MNKLDYSNGVQTRDGREAEVFAEREGVLWGRIRCAHDWVSSKWTIEGQYSGMGIRELDLSPLPKIEKRYACVHAKGCSGAFHIVADHAHREGGIGILAFTFRDGVPDVSVAPEWVK